MGKCIYCGEKAGFFKSTHKECELKFQQGKKEYVDEIRCTITKSKNFTDLENKLSEIRASKFINETLHDSLITEAFDLAVENFLEDGIISQVEEERIVDFKNHFNLSQELLNVNGSFVKVGMSSIIRDLTAGKVPPQRIKVDGQIPFLFQKSETLIYVFTDVEFYEQTTRTEYRGSSQGISIKVAKGLYYRTSAFKGNPVKFAEMKYGAKGVLALTTKHLYFDSPQKKFKIPYDKLISIQPYEDGIGIQKDGATAKPQIFKNIDGWFTHNVISNLFQN